MAAEKKVSIEDWCGEAGYTQFATKLKDELEFSTINDLFVLSEEDLSDVCKELGLKFGKKSRFIQAVKAASSKLSGVSNAGNNNNGNNNGNQKGYRGPKKNVSLVFLGETGVGKSTLLQSIKDFINGVPYEQVKCTEKGANGGSQSVTQTSDQFVLSNDEWAVNIIDTPGIGDTRGLDQDEKNMGDITNFLGDYGEFNAVCILIKRGSSRLTERFKYIVNEIRANLPKDVNCNFITIMTRADVAMPDKDTIQAIEELSLPTDNIIPINNLAYEELDFSKFSKDSPIYKATVAKAKSDYGANQMYLQILLETASKLKAYRGDKIKQLKIKRDLLKEEVGLLQLKIKGGFKLEQELNENIAELQRAVQNKQSYKDFFKYSTYTDRRYVKEHGKISTHCNCCSRVCHIDCGLGYGDDLNGCWCAGSNGCCKQCGHSMSNHTHLGWKEILDKKVKYVEDDAMKEKFQDATQREKLFAEARQDLEAKIAKIQKERNEQASKIGQLYKELSEMAIIGHNESAEKYMQECKKAIESAQLTQKEKQKRLSLIDSMIEKMQILQDVVQQYLPGH